jgi:geranylgeranyl reductase
MESYDVIIVGAGPAGLRCAEVLGGSRLEVLVTEKKSVIGPKVCAGGLTFLNGHFELPAADVLTFPIQRIELN